MKETIVQGLKVLAIPLFVFGTLISHFLLIAVAVGALLCAPAWYAYKRNAAPLTWAIKHAEKYWHKPFEVFTKLNNYLDKL